METILVLTHVDDSGSALTKASLEAVAEGKRLALSANAALSIGVLGAETNAAVQAMGDTGARILSVSGEAFSQARYATDAAACEALCRAVNPTMVLAPSSSRFARVAAGVAFRIGGAVDTHITGINADGEITATRWFYRQRIEATISRKTRPWFLLLEPGVCAPFVGEPWPVEIVPVHVDMPDLRTRVVGIRAPDSGAETIRPDAKMLFVAGAGWTKKQLDGQIHVDQAAKLILEFLGQSGASLGSSKSLVDQGGDGEPVLPFLTHMNQIGQTGATPRHPKGLATCCHGEEPHVVGWRFVGERRAISLDPNCGWARGKADVVYVADAFQVMEKVNALLLEK